MKTESSQNAEVTVIIPTTAEDKRYTSLKNAVSSIRKASSRSIEITVVVNGQRFSDIVVDWIINQCDINYLYSDKGSAPNAQLIGRKSVKTDFFCFLDDDDEFLPGAIDIRLEKIKEIPGTGIVVTNGYTLKSGTKKLQYQNFEKLVDAGIDGLLTSNWLGSCNHLMKTSIVSSSFFDDYHPYYEWTWLAFKICKAQVISKAVDIPTFIYNDTENSASKSADYRRSFESLALKMLKSAENKIQRKIIKTKLSAHYHRLSEENLNEKNYYMSVKLHAKSIGIEPSFRYLAYTRHIITKFIKDKFKT